MARTPFNIHEAQTILEEDLGKPKPQWLTGKLKGNLPATPRMFTGLDIGTTKVCAIIGEIHPSGRVTILGVASSPSQGLRRGVVINLEETVDSIRIAIRKAEEIAQVSVRDVFVGLAGGHIECHPLHGEIDVANPERGVTPADVRRLHNETGAGHMAVEREILHLIPQRYYIDDGPIFNPLGFSSKKLGVDLLLVTAAVTSAQNIIRAVHNAGYRTSSIYLEPLASSLAILSEEEKELGVVMVDIGGGTSDVAIWADNGVRYTGVVPFGGDAVTEDISKCLQVNRFDAENLKKRYGHCVPDAIDPKETVTVSGALRNDQRSIERRFLAEVIECRLEEMLHLVHKKVKSLSCYEDVYGGVVLTGGASLQTGITTIAERVFQKPAKLGVPTGLSGLSSVVSSPIYATGVGLVLYGLEREHEQILLDGNAFRRVFGAFKKFIDWYG